MMKIIVQYILGFILVIPVTIFVICWAIIKALWLYFGLTLVFATLLHVLDSEITPEKAIGYGGSMSVLWGIISKIRKSLKE